MSILRILAKLGGGTDCSGPHEINLSLFAGIPLQKIIYNSPASDLNLVLKLLQKGANVVIDNESDLHALNEMMANLGELPGKIFIRVNPDFSISYKESSSYQELTGHATESSKFGISSELLESVVPKTLKISGLHLHVGTQMDHLDSFKNAMEHLHFLADKLKKMGHPIEVLNMGGGLGISFSKDAKFPSISEFTSELKPLKRDDFTYAVEPGHALVGDTVGLLSKVLKIKNSRGKKWVVMDVGTDQLAKITLLNWQHRIYTNDSEVSTTGNDIVAGPLCFGGDNLLTEVDVTGIKVGDPLLISKTGAYCNSLGNRFNGRLAPGMVIVNNNGETKLVQENENALLDPIIQGEKWETFDSQEKIPIAQDLAQEMYQLGSNYLWHLAAADQYKIIKVHQIGVNKFEFKIITRSAVEFVSAPFALRIVGDCCIMSLLKVRGSSQKSKPVWGRNIVMNCSKSIESSKEITCVVSISSLQDGLSSSQKAMARFDLDDQKFQGTIELLF